MCHYVFGSSFAVAYTCKRYVLLEMLSEERLSNLYLYPFPLKGVEYEIVEFERKTY